MSSTTPDTQRLFFALWPAQSLQQLIHSRARQLIDKCVPADNLHLTLAFLGAGTPAQRACYEQAAGGIQNPAFTLSLETIDYWREPRILCLGTAQLSEPLAALVRALQKALAPCAFAPEARPFRAHMTLARKITRPLPVTRVEPLRWPVRDFVLAESVAAPDGVRYQVLRRWPLQEASTDVC